MRGFREVEKKFDAEKELKRREEERRNKEYLKIKPESNITLDEAKKFVNSLFEM